MSIDRVRPEDTLYPVGKSFVWGLQHVLTMYGGIIAPPLIIGSAAGLHAAELGMLVTAALFVSGCATLLQALGVPFFGSRLPLVQGVSFAGVATMMALVAGDGGLPVVFGAVIASSLIGLLIAPLFAHVIRFFPPVVTGTVITVIGLSLMPVAARWAMGGDADAPEWGSPGNIGLAALTLGLVLLFHRVGNAAMKRLAVLAAIVLGTLFAFVSGKAHFTDVLHGEMIALPGILSFGLPVFNVAAILSMTLIVLVLLTETTAGLIAIGEIIDTEVDGKRIASGLRADMLASALAPLFNSFPQSAFAQNIGLVAITGIKSRYVVAAGGIILVLLGCLPVLGRIVAAVPAPVLGGAGVVLFGTVGASGIRTLAKVDYKDTMNLVVVATAIAFGMIPIVMPTFYDCFPDWIRTIFHSGISAACVVAVLLNIVFNTIKGTPDVQESQSG
ncbi:xanthine permease [Erwinia persicina]|jgi:xanthine permease|uniref:Nucleobase:cation symporter-2 family protein n=2 Tax=Erwinia TaxID=551 RepID=A0ABV4EAH4_9GAMM|nr:MULTISPECIES: nucleobase:cation symporter-2 family protein [Erwinia]MCP1439191.1 xanthine permease [Erwinia persicina]MDN4627423.1 nucleobase:cation symporter-2 family protein [Erwinia sp. PsM31]MDN8543641.1 nucleobase:cation symporter-2 family protein [Erwinia sp. BC051422]